VVEFLSIAVLWVIVPGIMLALLVFDLTIVSAASRKSAELKLSARAGFWAGLLLFVIYVVSQLSKIQEPVFTFSGLPGLLVTPLLIGALSGFAFFLILRLGKLPQLIGFVVLALAAVAPSALFTYGRIR
jgi:hypothetical protein